MCLLTLTLAAHAPGMDTLWFIVDAYPDITPFCCFITPESSLFNHKRKMFSFSDL